MPLDARDDDAFGGPVVTLTPPDGLDALPEAVRDALPGALVAAFEDPVARLNAAAAAVGLPGFADFCAGLAARPYALEAATDSFAHDDDLRLVFGTLPTPNSPASGSAAVAAADPSADDTGADDLPEPPPLFDLAELEQAMPEGTLSPEMKAQMEALGAKMQRALAPRTSPGAPATADAPALSFVAPDVLDAPPLLEALYAAVGTIRLGPPGSSAGLVAAQPADYRLDAADPDYLAVFETASGDLLATTEDGSIAVWLRADDAGETPTPAGTLRDALDAVFQTLAEGRVPVPPEA